MPGPARRVPPQEIPRPELWRPGGAAPWAALDPAARRGISLERVARALAVRGQAGPVPAGVEAPRVPGPSVTLDEGATEGVRTVNAAVLALLFEESGEARLVLTRRSSTLRSHRGEVSFPGGRLDPGEDAPSAARREAYEEVGLEPALVRVAGWIHPVHTLVSGSLIMPIVATVEVRPHLVASPAEVGRVFDVALADLAEPAVFHEERWTMPGRGVAGGPDNSFAMWFFEVEGEMVWGATARMIHELLSLVLLPAPQLPAA